MLQAILVLLLSYLIGAIPFGLVMVRLFRGIDLREVGSGNIGATNAMRVLGKPLGLVAFLLDFGKGWIATFVLAGFAGALDSAQPGLAAALCGIAAVLGHCFPIYLGFKGGKGVATGCGAIVGVDYFVFLISGLVWLAALGMLRFVSVASLAMGAAFPLVAMFRNGVSKAHSDESFPSGVNGLDPSFTSGGWPFAVACALLTVLIVVRHRPNIVRLRAGTEPKIGRTKTT